MFEKRSLLEKKPNLNNIQAQGLTWSLSCSWLWRNNVWRTYHCI